MQDAVQRSLVDDLKGELCSRCLQPVPPKASRCPSCRQPVHSLRLLMLAIGAAGLLVLVFALLVMFRTGRNQDLVEAPAAVDESAAQPQDPFAVPPPANNDSNQPAKPEKKPPLNER